MTVMDGRMVFLLTGQTRQKHKAICHEIAEDMRGIVAMRVHLQEAGHPHRLPWPVGRERQPDGPHAEVHRQTAHPRGIISLTTSSSWSRRLCSRRFDSPSCAA